MYLSFYQRCDERVRFDDREIDKHTRLYRVFMALKNDMQQLFNTERRIDNAADFHLSDTLLNYGFINLKQFDLHSDDDHEAFRCAIQECIQLHEPRLTHISVLLNQKAEKSSDLMIDFNVYGTFILDEVSYALVLQSHLNTLGGAISIKDIKGVKDIDNG